MIKAALMKYKADSPKPLDEAAEMSILKMLIKQRTDAAEMFRKGGRSDSAEKEEAERQQDEDSKDKEHALHEFFHRHFLRGAAR